MAKIEEIEELIRGSGNNFHAKVARWLVQNGWHVVVSPYYMDQSQNKAREIDLIAERMVPIRDFSGKTKGHVVAKLFIECKFVASPSVFWFSNKDNEAAKELVYSQGPFRENNTYTQKHHYLSKSQRVAKLFASSTSKNSESEPFYKALNQALNAMVSMSGQPVSTPFFKKSGYWPDLVIEFPVVVCNSFDNLYSVDFDSESKPEQLKESFQLEVRYAYVDRSGGKRDDYFLLDFVPFDQLGALTHAIDEDLGVAAYLSED